MEEKNFKNIKFMVPMYEWPIDLYYGTPAEVKEHIATKYNLEFHTFDDYCLGYTAVMEKFGKKHKELNMFFFITNKDPKLLGAKDIVHTIHHEAIHTSWFILDYVGVKVDADNHEALTYLECFIAEKVYDQITKWKKESEK